MKKLIKIVCLVLFVLILKPYEAVAEVNLAESMVNGDNGTKTNAQIDWSPVINAIIKVESNGNTRAKHGNSVGAMQITPVLILECNQIMKKRKSKKRFKLSDRFSISKSKEMFLIMQSYYNPMNDIELAIRMWNGGMHYSISRTQRYFEKVMSYLK